MSKDKLELAERIAVLPTEPEGDLVMVFALTPMHRDMIVTALKAAAAPTREEIARIILRTLVNGEEADFSGNWLCPQDDEGALELVLMAADAIIALKAAPAKPEVHHVTLGSDLDDGQRGKERE